MGHEDAAAEVGFGKDVGEGGGVVDVETGKGVSDAVLKACSFLMKEELECRRYHGILQG